MNALLGDTFSRENNTHGSRFHDRDPQFASRILGAMTQSCYIGTRDIRSRVIRGLYCSSNNSYWQYCDISNCFLWVPQNWITYTDLAHMWQNQCHSCPPNSHLFASSLKTHFPYWPISRIEPGPGRFVLDMVILVAQLQSRELCRESCKGKFKTWNICWDTGTNMECNL